MSHHHTARSRRPRAPAPSLPRSCVCVAYIMPAAACGISSRAAALAFVGGEAVSPSVLGGSAHECLRPRRADREEDEGGFGGDGAFCLDCYLVGKSDGVARSRAHTLHTHTHLAHTVFLFMMLACLRVRALARARRQKKKLDCCRALFLTGSHRHSHTTHTAF